jgi:GalNAc-alpha-(1->4)-GalNAc-alpha-(1->3)-diNAcBac-PP-undecaprenol alpha-1,4-N-acetyl-D-galactosaminyltransferase
VKICCVISSLESGGAERVLSLLATRWATRGQDVTIVTVGSAASDHYELGPGVDRVALDLETDSNSLLQAVTNNFVKIRGLRGAVASLAPDVVISFLDKVNVLTIFSCIGLKVPVVVSERVHPVHYDIGRIWSLLRRLAYARVDALVVQSESMRSWAETVVPVDRTHVIPNPVGDELSNSVGGVQSPRKPIVLAVGRLVPQKGFDLLIRAFHEVVQRHPEWSLVIVGQGPKQAELKQLATALLPQGSVSFAGSVKDPGDYYRTAGLFVLPSRFEGFPNALLEAMAVGCAVIATDSPGGMSEIVRHGVDGLLVPPEDVRALAREMDRLMSDGDERSRLGARAVDVVSRFAVDRILALWEDVISQVRRSC